jgi:hypothetical protein
MAKVMDLFDLIDIEEGRSKPEECPHKFEDETFTIWPGEDFERMTYTCKACGRIRGRCSSGYKKPTTRK